MIKRIVVASNNAHKIEEIANAFKPYDVEIKSIKDMGLVSDPEENGNEFQDNAYIKAKTLSLLTNEVVLSDDSGLSVHALNNFPGVHSARFMKGHPYNEKWAAINSMLEKQSDKSADFKTIICIMNLEPMPLFFEGRVDGIITSPRGEGGFGYDPIFFVPSENQTYGEMSLEKKNSLSHRGRALAKTIDYLLKFDYIKKQ